MSENQENKEPDNTKKIQVEIKQDEQKQSEKEKELTQENEDLRNKLGIIAEKELEKKRNEIRERAKPFVKDNQELAKELEEKLKGAPEEVKAIEFTVSTLEKTVKTSQKREAPSGSAPLQTGYEFQQNQNLPLRQRKFANIQEAIKYLEAERKSDQHGEGKEADKILGEMLIKGIQGYKVAGKPSMSYSPDSEITPTTRQPTINLEAAKEEFSELERFGVKKKKGKNWGSMGSQVKVQDNENKESD